MFKKGESGNPKGRPKGVKNVSTEVRAIWDELFSLKDDVVKAVIDGIKGGNFEYIKLYCQFVLPKIEPLHSTDIKFAGKVASDKIEAISKALDNNEIDIKMANKLTSLAKTQGDVVLCEAEELLEDIKEHYYGLNK